MSVLEIFFQFLGFLLQMLPVSILYLVPFPDSSLRLPRRKLSLLLGGGIVLLSAGFAFMAWLIFDPSGSHNFLLRIASNLYMTACILLYTAAFFTAVRVSAMKKTIVLVLLIHYAAVLFTLNSTFIGIMAGNVQDNPDTLLVIYGIDSLVVNAALLMVTFPLIYLFLKHEIRFGLSYMENRTLRRGCIYLLLALLLFVSCVFSLNSFKYYYGFSEKAVILFLTAFILTDCILYFMFFSEVRLTVQIRQHEEQLRSFNEQYRQINSSIDEARRARHDIRHHLNLISTMNHQGKQEELEAYLEAYEVSFQELENMPLCGYPAFDNILQYYIEAAGRQGIKVKTEFFPLRESLGFDVIDLTIMLGNLMENAIEACCKLPPDTPRTIRIWVKQANVAFLLEVENSCPDTNNSQPDFTDYTRFISTKHVKRHGQGLKSVQFAAEKYGGNAEFRETGGVFTARVVMNIP